MSLLIKGEMMPDSCGECPCLRHDSLEGIHGYQCNLTLRVFLENSNCLYDSRPSDCPLEKVPETN